MPRRNQHRPGRDPCFGRWRGFALPPKAGRKAKGRAAPRLACQADRPAHHLAKLLGDTEAEPGAAVAAGRRTVCLSERVKDAPLFLRRDPDAAIADVEREHHRWTLGLDRLDPNTHLAPIGKLDRIADQVCQDLPQPRRIADQRRRQAHRNKGRKLKPLRINRIGKGFDDVLNQIAQIERRLLQLDLAGLDLRDVEDTVDDLEQHLGRAAGRLEIVLLPRSGFGVAHEFQHAENTVHRRAQLMRHVGKKLGLGVVGRLGFQHALMRLLPGSDKRVTRAAPIQDGAELPAILGHQRYTSVSSLLDHPRILLSRLGKGNNGAEMQNIGYANALSSRGPRRKRRVSAHSTVCSKR